VSKKSFLVDTLLKRAEDFKIQKKPGSAAPFEKAANTFRDMSEAEFLNILQHDNLLSLDGMGLQLEKIIKDILSFAPKDDISSSNYKINSLEHFEESLKKGLKESILISKDINVRSIMYLLHKYKTKSVVSISTDSFLVNLKE